MIIYIYQRLFTIYIMKIAFCHDWIYHIGGAEGVFFDLIQKYDKSEYISDIYTIFSDRKNINIQGKNYKIHTALPTWLCKIFVYFSKKNIIILSQIFDYRNLMFWFIPLIYILSKKINKQNPDLVVISNSACIKNINIKNSLTRKILYLHSPLMYIRNHYDDNVMKLKWIIKYIYIFIVKFLRPWDLKHRKYNEIFANSQYTKNICQSIYNFENIKVLYPTIHLAKHQSQNQISFDSLNIPFGSCEYYVYIGRLVRFSKDLDTIINLFNQNWHKLLIIWSWPDQIYLKSIAKNNIYFGGYISDIGAKIRILQNSKWLTNLTIESFGIITAEAMICGLPVFGYNIWWSKELVDPKSWILVNDKSINNLTTQFEIFDKTKWDSIYISDRAKKMFW